MGYLYPMVVLVVRLVVGHLSCQVEVLCFACLEEVLSLVGLLVDRLVSCLEVGHLSLVVLLVAFPVVVRLSLVVVLYCLVVVLYYRLVEVLQPYSQFFLLAHQLSRQLQARHHQ